MVLQFGGAVTSGVRAEHPPTRGLADMRRGTGKRGNGRFRTIGENDLVIGLEPTFDAAPTVGEDWRASSACREQPDGWRPTGGNHVGTGHVERHPGSIVEPGVLGWRQMLDP